MPVAPESAGELRWGRGFLFSPVGGSLVLRGVGGERGMPPPPPLEGGTGSSPPPPPLERGTERGSVRAVSVEAVFHAYRNALDCFCCVRLVFWSLSAS